MKKAAFTILFTLLFFQLISQQNTRLYKNAESQKVNQWVDSVFQQLTLDEKIGQMFMPIVEPNSSYKSIIKSYIDNYKVGGFLFSKGSIYGQADNTNYAQNISRIPLLISVDAEWGLAMRLKNAPEFPKNQIIGSIANDDVFFQYGKEMARQCKLMGIHVNFSPSLDINTNPYNPIIGDRSFGSNPDRVSRQGIAFAKGVEAGGVMSVAKHFPGHGDTSADSHKTLPTISHNLTRLNSVELFPFKNFVSEGLSGMMIGHLNVPALQTKGMPSSLSSEVVTDLLKKKMGFTGLVFTDGMAMKGVNSQPNLSVRALLAGNDIILGVPNIAREFKSVKSAVQKGTISNQILDEKVKKILTYKYLLNAHKFTPIKTSDLQQELFDSQYEWTQNKLHSNGLVLLKNDSNIVPLKNLDKTCIASVYIGKSFYNDFHSYLRKYDDVRTFQMNTMEQLSTFETEMDKFDLIIYSIDADRFSDSKYLQRIIKKKPSVLVLSGSPLQIDSYKASIRDAQVVLLAPDNSSFTQQSVAQAIFGGIHVSGSLQLSTSLYPLNYGLSINKTRLGYNLPEEVGISSENLSKIDEIANEGIQQRAYPGCQVLVAKNGIVIYEKAFGTLEYNSNEKVTLETVYDLASVTKATATLSAIMKLYDAKKLHLNDELYQFLPKIKKSDKGNISIRELLFHESGLPSFLPYHKITIDKDSYHGDLFGKKSDIYNVYYAGAWARTDYQFKHNLISSVMNDTYKYPIAAGMYGSEKLNKLFLQEILKSKLVKRGEYKYSDLNFILLKEVVENIAKTDLNSFVQNNFFERLGANSTTYLPLQNLNGYKIAPTENDPFFRKQLVKGYVHDESAALLGGVSGNAGLFSNANDLAKLLQMWLNFGEYGNEKYLSPKTVAMFTQAKSDVSRRGLGFDKPDINPDKSPVCAVVPLSTFGHTGFTGTCFWVDPKNQLIYIFLSNRVNPTREPNKLSTLEIRERIQDVIYKAIQAN